MLGEIEHDFGRWAVLDFICLSENALTGRIEQGAGRCPCALDWKLPASECGR